MKTTLIGSTCLNREKLFYNCNRMSGAWYLIAFGYFTLCPFACFQKSPSIWKIFNFVLSPVPKGPYYPRYV